MSREEGGRKKVFRGKKKKKKKNERHFGAFIFETNLFPSLRLNPTYFSSFRFCRGSSTIRYAAEFFRVKRICSPRITFPSGNIFVSISLSLCLCFLRVYVDTVGKRRVVRLLEKSPCLSSPSIEQSKKTRKSGSAKIVGAEDANKRRFCRGSLDLVENPCRTATIYYPGVVLVGNPVRRSRCI